MGYVLVDDPEAFLVGGKDEGVAKLAEGFEGGESSEGVGQVGVAGGRDVKDGSGRGFRIVVAYGDGVAIEGEAAGGLGDKGRGEVEGSGVLLILLGAGVVFGLGV